MHEKPIAHEVTVTSSNVPKLNPGELYAGIIAPPFGVPSYHLIVLPEKVEANWQNARAFADRVGGELPYIFELKFLYARFKYKFTKQWYWAIQEHQIKPESALFYSFVTGRQGAATKESNLRAMAVKRIYV